MRKLVKIRIPSTKLENKGRVYKYYTFLEIYQIKYIAYQIDIKYISHYRSITSYTKCLNDRIESKKQQTYNAHNIFICILPPATHSFESQTSASVFW